jgi:hypothetical protein
MKNIPDQECPITVDNPDPCFVDGVGDLIQNRWIRVEPLDWDLLQFLTFSSLLAQRSALCGLHSTYEILFDELDQLGNGNILPESFEGRDRLVPSSVRRLLIRPYPGGS